MSEKAASLLTGDVRFLSDGKTLLQILENLPKKSSSSQVLDVQKLGLYDSQSSSFKYLYIEDGQLKFNGGDVGGITGDFLPLTGGVLTGDLGVGTLVTPIGGGYGTIHIAGSNGGGIRFGSTNTSLSQGLFYSWANQSVIMGASSNHPLELVTNNVTRMTIATNGNITTTGSITTNGAMSAATWTFSQGGYTGTFLSQSGNSAFIRSAATIDLTGTSIADTLTLNTTSSATPFARIATYANNAKPQLGLYTTAAQTVASLIFGDSSLTTLVGLSAESGILELNWGVRVANGGSLANLRAATGIFGGNLTWRNGYGGDSTDFYTPSISLETSPTGYTKNCLLIQSGAGLIDIRSDNGTRFRNKANNADAPITAGAGTFSGNINQTAGSSFLNSVISPFIWIGSYQGLLQATGSGASSNTDICVYNAARIRNISNTGFGNLEAANITTNGLIRFGGTTAGFPALKRNGSFLEVRQADDSNLSSLHVGDLYAYYNISAAISVLAPSITGESISTNTYLYLYDPVEDNYNTLSANGGNILTSGGLTVTGNSNLLGPAINISQTWNAVGSASLINGNVTYTSGGGPFSLIDLRVNNTSRFSVEGSAGNVNCGGVFCTNINGTGFILTSSSQGSFLRNDSAAYVIGVSDDTRWSRSSAGVWRAGTTSNNALGSVELNNLTSGGSITVGTSSTGTVMASGSGAFSIQSFFSGGLRSTISMAVGSGYDIILNPSNNAGAVGAVGIAGFGGNGSLVFYAASNTVRTHRFGPAAKSDLGSYTGNGHNLQIFGGDASNGNSNGGHLYIFGGAGFGTGVNGNISLAHTGSAVRGRVLIGTVTDDGVNLLQVNGSIYTGTSSYGISLSTGVSQGGILNFTQLSSQNYIRCNGTNHLGIEGDRITLYQPIVLNQQSIRGTDNGSTAQGVVIIRAGNVGATNSNGGNVFIYGGTPNGTGTEGDVILSHNGVSAIGNVLIGTTTDNGQRLQVSGTSLFSGKITGAASTTSAATLNIPHGTAPTSPVNGDIWTTTAGLFARINNATIGPFGAGGGSSSLSTLSDVSLSSPANGQVLAYNGTSWVNNTRVLIGSSSFIVGTGNTSSGSDSITMGTNNTSSGQHSFTNGGTRAVASKYGQFAHAAGRFVDDGDAQYVRYVMRCSTTGSTGVNMTLDGSSARLTIPNDTVFAFTVNIVGIKADGSSVSNFYRKGVIKNIQLTTSLVGTIQTLGTDHEDNTATNVTITADNTNKALQIQMTGITGENWRWVAYIEGVELKAESPGSQGI